MIYRFRVIEFKNPPQSPFYKGGFGTGGLSKGNFLPLFVKEGLQGKFKNKQ